jgi:dTDP-glucose 4,6-dehydratase
VRVLEKGVAGESYNIGGHNEKCNLEVVELLCDILDRKVGLPPSGKPRRELITFVRDRLGHDRRYAIDAAKISSELEWTPKMTFDAGMEKTVDWYLNNSKWLDSVINGSYREYYRQMYGER